MTSNASLTFCCPCKAVGLVLAVVAPGTAQAVAQADSIVNHPKQALRRAILPGRGQWYNRQFVKIPVVYAGLGGFTWAALHTNGRYLLYRHAYLYTARRDADGEPVFPEYAADYAALLSDLGLASESSLTAEETAARRARLEPQFRAFRDAHRRNRDLLFLGIAAWYGLTVLDAFVSAHLTDFDVGEDLAFGLHPEPLVGGMKATVRLKL